MPERLAVMGFDGFHSLTQRRVVPFFGDPRMASVQAVGSLPQHPRFRSYWLDRERNAAVAMFIGVDVMPGDGAYHVLELNLGAGLRTGFTDATVDPTMRRLVDFAGENGYRRLIVLRRRWNRIQQDVMLARGREVGVECVAASRSRSGARDSGARMTAPPVELERDTLYVLCTTNHTALDYLVHDKAATAGWLTDYLGEEGRVRSVPTFREPFVPTHTYDSWPNLVVKLASWDMGRFVRFFKIDPNEDPIEQLGISHPGRLPDLMGIKRSQGLLLRILQRHRVLYQPFVPCTLTSDGRFQRFRVNVLVGPGTVRYLSAYVVSSKRQAPTKTLPFGPVNDTRQFIWSAPGNGVDSDGVFSWPNPAQEADLGHVAGVVGQAIQQVVEARFEVHS